VNRSCRLTVVGFLFFVKSCNREMVNWWLSAEIFHRGVSKPHCLTALFLVDWFTKLSPPE
jgi:hypothetical protein